MGFVFGKRVRVVLNAPLLDPIEYEIIGYKISLRREEADQIEVVSEEEVKHVSRHRIADLTIEASQCVDDEFMEQEMKRIAIRRKREIRVALVGNPNCGKHRCSISHPALMSMWVIIVRYGRCQRGDV